MLSSCRRSSPGLAEASTQETVASPLAGGGMDLKLINATVRTMHAHCDPSEALAVAGDRILCVGTNQDVLDLDLPGAEIVDLGGRTVMPGFVDSHAHAFATGLTFISADLSGARDVQDICERMRESVVGETGRRWIFGLGCSPWLLREQRFPTLAELDAVLDDRPAYITSTTFHSGATNSAGLRELAADPALARTPGGPEAGWFLDDESHFAAARLAFSSLDDADIGELLRQVAELAASRGVTSLHCLEGQFIHGDRDVQVLHERAEELPVHVVLMYQTMDVDRVVEMGLPRIGGCLAVDGACFEHTACFYDPYVDRPETSGRLNYAEDVIVEFVDRAHRAGLQIGMHAIGDKAIDVLVGAYAAAMRANPRPDCRHRVEHFQLPTEWAIEQAAKLRLALPMQPIFSYLWDNPGHSDYERSFGSERAERMEPFARLARLGFTVCGGSDSPVTPIDPLRGIHAAANNPRASRRTDVDTVLRMFTVNGAWVAHEEHERGTITAGKVADLVVLSGDPYVSSADEITVEITFSRGRLTYLANGSKVLL